jgi:hypothetical protein
MDASGVARGAVGCMVPDSSAHVHNNAASDVHVLRTSKRPRFRSQC